MAYIGQRPSLGNFRKLDSIESQFNGTDTEFSATVFGTLVNLYSEFQIIAALNDEILEPGEDFTLGQGRTSIVFDTAPDPGDTFWCIVIGDATNVGTLADNIVTASKLADNSVTSNKILDGAVTSTKYAAGSITTDAYANNSINVNKIINGSITSDKLANSSVNTSKMTDEAVTFAKLNTNVRGTKAELEAQTTSKLVLADLAKHLPGMAKAWVNFNGTNGTVTTPIIRSSYNVASTSRSAPGRYSVTFQNPMSDANYVVVANFVQTTSGTNIGWAAKVRNQTVNGFDIVTGTDGSTSGSLIDAQIVTAVVYGTLA